MIFCVGSVEFNIIDFVSFGILEFILVDLVLLRLIMVERLG